MRVTSAVLAAVSLCTAMLAFSGCGKGNVFSWAHRPGQSGTIDALSSDAYTALCDQDYAKAMDYYEQILKKDPGNSDALYGYSTARLADAGLDISSLIASLLENQRSDPAGSLSYALSYMAHAPAASDLLPSTVLSRIAELRLAVDQVLANDRLPMILRGQGDGRIAPDNPDVNLNVAFCLVLRAAIRVYDSGAIVFHNDYSVTVNYQDPATVDVANASGRDIVSALHRLEVVARQLNLGSDATIVRIRDDVKALFDALGAQVSGFDVEVNRDYLLY